MCNLTSCLQGTHFGVATIDRSVYLSASCGEGITTVPLHVESVTIENSLQAAGHDIAGDSKMPVVNKRLNYFHSMCDRFPLDDALSLKSKGRRKRTVQLHLCSGALQSSP